MQCVINTTGIPDATQIQDNALYNSFISESKIPGTKQTKAQDNVTISLIINIPRLDINVFNNDS